MARVNRLRHGSIVRWVSPASPIDSELLVRASSMFESWGLKIEIADHALDRHFYLVGTDENRAKDITDAFLDPRVDGIFCTRGGYGSARLMPYLDFPRISKSEKLFLGFSDISTLHLALNHCDLPTFHGPMGITLHYDREEWVYKSLRDMVFGNVNSLQEFPGGEVIVPGTGEGILTGGCLCLLCDSLATSYPIHGEGKIILLEDVDENPHRIDAMLTHLLNSGVFRHARGIVVGEMTRTDDRMDETIGARPWRDIVIDRLGSLGLPLILNYPIGHAKNMLTLPLGVKARLDAEDVQHPGRLSIVENPFEL